MIILTAAGSLDSFVQLITILLLFLFVLVITYVVTRWVSGVQTMRISNSKYLQIVRAGEKYLVIAVCKDTVTMLTELSAEEVSLGGKNEVNSLSFREIMDKMKQQKNPEK